MILSTAAVTAHPRGLLAPQVRQTALNATGRVRRGRILEYRLTGDREQPYYIYIPRMAAADAPVVVTVHGISRNAMQHMQRLRRFAEARRAIVVAPLFTRERFPDFQRLGRPGKGLRADFVLDAILADLTTRTGFATDRFYLFGFSGGAQFAHRYLFANPARVISAGLAAAGWYTMPDPAVAYPFGLGASRNMPLGLNLANPAAFRVPVHVFVGERDTRRDPALRKGDKVDPVQGRNRIERAECWVGAMRKAARERDLATNYTLDLLPSTAHSFTRATQAGRGNLGAVLFNRLFGAALS